MTFKYKMIFIPNASCTIDQTEGTITLSPIYSCKPTSDNWETIIQTSKFCDRQAKLTV